MRTASIFALTLLVALAPQALVAQDPWTVGQHVKVWYPRPGGSGPAWRTGVITEVFSWGVHMKFDDQDHVEVFGNDEIKPVDAPAAAPRPAAAPAAAAPAPRPQAATAAPKPAAPQQQAVAAGPCPSDAGLTTAGTTLTSQIKHAIYENYAADIDGGLSAPLAIGVTFQSFQIGTPLPNRVGPAGYEYPNAERGAPIYPVTTRHTYCRQYRNATNRTLFSGKYVCFKTRFGNGMECGTSAGHTILGYQ